MKHPQAGKPVKCTKGPYKDRFLIVVDYFQNQYQGKNMQKLLISQKELLQPVVDRGFSADSLIVLGKLYPDLKFVCVHDSEIQVEELPPNVALIGSAKKKKEKKK